ncbi:prolyl oligopeptidase family serine peptidase [Acidobacteria bacterium AH-259-O06]|nr:prolyl oligopeptidase family serine peptidase [Acidobacteria bacterium AH-259-O06]
MKRRFLTRKAKCFPRRNALYVSLFTVMVAFPVWSEAQQTADASGYRIPPKALVDLVDARLTPLVSVGTSQQWMLLMELPTLPSIDELSQPELRVAGLRINPRSNGRSRSRYFLGLKLKRIEDGSQKAVTGIPAGARIGNVEWAPDGKNIAFTLTQGDRVELWVAEVQTGAARPVLDVRLNAAYGQPLQWLADSQALVCKVVPADRGPTPSKPTVPSSPTIQENLGGKAPARTYQDLLESAHDEALFEYYTTAQVVRVTLKGENHPIGTPAITRTIKPAPNGEMLLVETVHRPYSYLVPVHRFAHRVEVWDLEGKVVHQVADLPLAEDVPIPFGSVPTGPRNFGWRADTPGTLYWVEAQDGGDAGKEASVRDRVYMLPAPFSGKPQAVITLGLRLAGIQWSNEDVALVSESWWQTRRTRTWVVRPGALEAEPKLLFDRSTEDHYNDPGSPLSRRTASGHRVLLTANNGKKIFLTGQGASPEGNRPFLDELDLTSGKVKRLWRSEAPYYERPVKLLDAEAGLLMTSRESVEEPPNYYVQDLKRKRTRRLTNFPHPTPQLRNVQKELITYRRNDGVQLNAALYLPPGYSPMLMWAYPREYKSADAAGQVTDSPHRFVDISPTSSLVFLALDYAVLDRPSMPIIGQGDKEPNDTYVEQLVASAKAAVDQVVQRGVAHPDHIAIGGHSYGAFMVANLLARSDLFAAGIARSGAYNRTLTPFGFQREQRTFWQAPEVYFRMSPFMHAQKINEPILLIHGMADNNSGTFPIQSKRFYHALKGHGATARLVMLPHESHGYRARESVLHMLWEMTEWLEKYLRRKQESARITSARTP